MPDGLYLVECPQGAGLEAWLSACMRPLGFGSLMGCSDLHRVAFGSLNGYSTVPSLLYEQLALLDTLFLAHTHGFLCPSGRHCLLPREDPFVAS